MSEIENHDKQFTDGIRYMPVATYCDPDGNPSCAADFSCGKVCSFYESSLFGTIEHCFFGERAGKSFETLKRRGDGTGTLIPLSNCPIWHRQRVGVMGGI